MKLLRLVIVLGVLLILVAVVGIEYTSRPSFCNSCHEISPKYTAWEQSSHNEVYCLECHSEPGFTGLMKTKIKGLGELYSHVTNVYERPITITSDTWEFSQRCFSCHEDIERGTEATGPHNKKHWGMKLPCTQCHTGLVHDSETNNRLPTRKVCVDCHGSEM